MSEPIIDEQQLARCEVVAADLLRELDKHPRETWLPVLAVGISAAMDAELARVPQNPDYKRRFAELATATHESLRAQAVNEEARADGLAKRLSATDQELVQLRTENRTLRKVLGKLPPALDDLPDHVEVRPDRDGDSQFVEVWGWGKEPGEDFSYLFTLEVAEFNTLAAKAREVALAAGKGDK